MRWIYFLFSAIALPVSSLPLEKLTLPEGFSIEIYVEGLPNARQMAMGENGTLFVGSRREGKVYAVTDENKDGKPEKVQVIADNLFMPSGLTYKDGALYVAEVNQIIRFSKIEASLPKVPEREVVFDKLPNARHHGWKYIDFGPDGMLYVPVGAPCNVCDDDAPFSSILKVNVETGEFSYVARGVRNSVGFDWHPETQEFWFSDNGRDMMGDNLPPCEINHVTKDGQHFGFPYFHAGIIPDPDFAKDKKPEDYRGPAYSMAAHVAPLGIHFYHGDMFPKDYQNRLFIAEHGSWNRSEKVGYKISMLTLNEGQEPYYQTFIEGWLQGQESWGRPVALLPISDGSLLISDDQAGVIYRVSYNKN